MAKTIRIRKGADIKLVGTAKQQKTKVQDASTFALKPADFHGVIPKMLVKEGEGVQIGTPLFHDKANADIVFTSPASGKVKSIVRGEKRRILAVEVENDNQNTMVNHGSFDPKTTSREEVIGKLLKSGAWPMVMQRPFSSVANPSDTPKAIFVSGFDSAPLAIETDTVLTGHEAVFQTGIDVLVNLNGGKKIHLGTDGSKALASVQNVELTQYNGPHPAGNVGVQIHKTAPINKGDVVWYVNYQDVLNIGRVALSGHSDFSRTIALAGEGVKDPACYELRAGNSLTSFLSDKLKGGNFRIISGDVLSGDKIAADGYLGYYHNQITVIPEGDKPLFILGKGWLGPGFDKFSLSRAFPTWLMGNKKQYKLNTNNNGEERAFVVSGQYEKVFPFDIYPVQLVKSIIVNDIEAMENLGIYEVAPEDFALCEYGCTSKIHVQQIVREGLDTLMEEFK